MSSGDLASSYRGRLSIGNLQRHTPWVLSWVPRATSRLTAQFNIITSVTVVRYCRAAPLGVHVCLRWHTSCSWERSVQQYALSQYLSMWGMPRNLAPRAFCSQDILISFKHLCNILIMLLKTFTNLYILLIDIHQSQWCWVDIIVYTNSH